MVRNIKIGEKLIYFTIIHCDTPRQLRKEYETIRHKSYACQT